MIHDNLLSLIGNTPIVRLTQFDTGPCELFIKLECQNPGGSVKDRIALSMIEQAERDGHLTHGGCIVEATAGNTGIALAMIAALKHYRMIVVMPDKMSREKAEHLSAMGAEVVWTRSDVNKGHPEYYQDVAERIAHERGAFYVNQFANPHNPEAHYRTTGPEIWSQMDNNLDAFVCGAGTSGTVTGVGRYLKEQNPAIDIVLADPVGSILKHYIDTGELLTKSGSWLVEGIGEDYLPVISDFSVVNKAYTITDHEAMHLGRELLKKTGIFAGSSSGILLGAALQYCREQTSPKRVLTLACDGGAKYASKMYNDAWMREKGLLD
jgi:cystathionine beta-synthase